MVQFEHSGTVKSFIYIELFFGSIYIVIYMFAHACDACPCVDHNVYMSLEVFRMNVIL